MGISNPDGKMWKLCCSGSTKYVCERKDFKHKQVQQPHKWKAENGGATECSVTIVKEPKSHHPVCEAHFNGKEFVKESKHFSTNICDGSKVVRFYAYSLIIILLILSVISTLLWKLYTTDTPLCD